MPFLEALPCSCSAALSPVHLLGSYHCYLALLLEGTTLEQTDSSCILTRIMTDTSIGSAKFSTQEVAVLPSLAALSRPVAGLPLRVEQLRLFAA